MLIFISKTLKCGFKIVHTRKSIYYYVLHYRVVSTNLLIRKSHSYSSSYVYLNEYSIQNTSICLGDIILSGITETKELWGLSTFSLYIAFFHMQNYSNSSELTVSQFIYPTLYPIQRTNFNIFFLDPGETF